MVAPTYIYVCCSTLDKSKVDDLDRNLASVGATTVDVAASTSWETQARSQVLGCVGVVFLIRPESVNSRYCNQELDWAFGAGIPVLPVRVSDAYVTLSVEVAGIQQVDATEYDAETLAKAVSEWLDRLQEAPQEQPSSGTESVGLTLLRDFGRETERREQIRATPVVARVLSSGIHDHDDGAPPHVSLSSLLPAITTADHDLARRVTPVLLSGGSGEAALLARRRMTSRDEIPSAASAPIVTGELRVSRSLGGVLDAGRALADRTGPPRQPLDLVHLIAGLAYDAETRRQHAREFQSYGLDLGELSTALVAHVGQARPTEKTAWVALHATSFPELPLPASPELSGSHVHLASDLWTVDDRLGLMPYAHAIYQFLSHEKTSPPLTVGIQAPWGGGKTSLMRMIQQKLDPVGFASAVAALKVESLDSNKDRHLSVREAWRKAVGQDEGRDEGRGDKPDPDAAGKCSERLTIWFNAWKYQSTNEVWAGLADAILRQASDRMTPYQRERFWWGVNLQRVDTTRVRQRIHNLLLTAAWRASWWLVLAAVALLGVGLATLAAEAPAWLTNTPLWLAGGSALAAVGRAWVGMRAAQEQPVSNLFNDLVDAPDYRQEVGFVHKVEADLRRILHELPELKLLTERNKPIVVFIDDLDRCSPTKVAEVVEAVNLFIAGDLPRCIFVLGMDAEVVAASLQFVHSGIAEHLPSEAGGPVGWRFMDKFVQLPVAVPPPDPTRLTPFYQSLLVPKEDRQWEASVDEAPGQEPTPAGTSVTPPSDTAEQEAARAEAGERERAIDRGVEEFDDNEEIEALIGASMKYLSTNPREIKRFLNAFRFQHLMWLAGGETDKVSLRQVQRYAVLSVRWPEVVRWCWRGETRLLTLESAASTAQQFAVNVKKATQLDPGTTRWLADRELAAFFAAEQQHEPASDRLSAVFGKGLF